MNIAAGVVVELELDPDGIAGRDLCHCGHTDDEHLGAWAKFDCTRECRASRCQCSEFRAKNGPRGGALESDVDRRRRDDEAARRRDDVDRLFARPR